MPFSRGRGRTRAALRGAALPLLLLLSLASAVSTGCASIDATAAADPARLYARRCALCHPLHRPGSFPGDVWEASVKRFGARAGLTRAEREAVLRYLLENASDTPPRAGTAARS